MLKIVKIWNNKFSFAFLWKDLTNLYLSIELQLFMLNYNYLYFPEGREGSRAPRRNSLPIEINTRLYLIIA